MVTSLSQIGLFLVLALFVLCALFFFKWNLKLSRRRNNYRQLATRYGGNLVNGVFFAPKMWFRYGQSTGSLVTRRKRGGHEHTILALLWPDNRLRFQIVTEGFLARSIWGSSAQTLNAQELGFNRDFSIATNNLEEFKNLCVKAVCWKIEQLANQLGTGAVSIKLKSGKLTITKPGKIGGYQQLDDLLRLCLEVYDELLLTQCVGVEFVDDEQAQILDDVKCPICSEVIERKMVICVRCKTPHCKDCWEYNSHCATFACNEMRYYESN